VKDTKPQTAMDEKQCTICFENKNIDDFIRTKSICKNCNNAKRRQKYKENPEHREKLIKMATVFKHNKVLERQQLRQAKLNELSEKITKYMSENEHSKIKLSDGELRLYDKKEYSPLTFGYIEKTLAKIIQDHEQLDYVVKYLKENREITTISDIKRTYDK
jgi:hypothetical protein